MEQKKILWIIISVTVFLCIVLGVGLLWLSPSKNAQTSGKSTVYGQKKAGMDFDPIEWVRNSRDYPGLTTTNRKDTSKNGNFTIVYGENPGQSAPEPVDTARETPKVSLEVKKQVFKATPPPRKPVKVVSRAVETPKVAAAPKKQAVREYWIQAGSYKSRSSADNARTILSKQGISSRITIKTIGSVDYYRVRIGPYSQKAEADKFLGWVKKLHPFDTSYISMVTVKR